LLLLLLRLRFALVNPIEMMLRRLGEVWRVHSKLYSQRRSIALQDPMS